MDFITADPIKLYKKYLIPSMGSALAVSIYSFVDTIAVGQSEGELGAAAMAVICPLFGFMVFLSILCGIGGSVLLSAARGEGKPEKANAFFTIALGMIIVLTLIFWGLLLLFHDPIFMFLGADEVILAKVMEYAKWIIWTFPVFIAPTFIGSFLRNDGAPTLNMAAVIIGGCVNMFGDWFFVFPLGMRMEGAAIAQAAYLNKVSYVINRSGDLIAGADYVRAFFPEKVRPASGKARELVERRPENLSDRRGRGDSGPGHGLYRRLDEQSDHAVRRPGGAGGLRRCVGDQPLIPGLFRRRGADDTAFGFGQLRRGGNGTHPAVLALRLDHFFDDRRADLLPGRVFPGPYRAAVHGRVPGSDCHCSQRVPALLPALCPLGRHGPGNLLPASHSSR